MNEVTTDDLLKPVQRRLLVPFTVVLLLLISGFAIALMSLHQTHLDQANRLDLETALSQLQQSLKRETLTLTALQDAILTSTGLRKALKTGDRKRLRLDSKDLFAKIQAKYGITHFSFHRPDRVNLLRLRQPQKQGDRIDRFTLRESARTGKTVSGLELDSLGTFSLRVVRPVFDGGALIGYLELGKEMGGLLKEIQNSQGAELALIIHKTVLEQSQWEAGMRMLKRKADWNRYTDVTLGYSSLPRLPALLDRFIEGEQPLHGSVIPDVKFDSKYWRIMFEPLRDASGAVVGDLIILRNISESKKMFQRLLGVTFGGILLLVTALIGFLYISLRRVDRGVSQQHAKLVKNEERLELAMSVANDGIWDWNLHDNAAEFDARYYTMAGYAPNEYPGTVEAHDKRIHPDDLQQCRQALEQLLTGVCKTYDIEFRFLRKDGDYMWIRAKGKIVSRDEKGKPLRFVGTRTDISKRKQSEDALKASEAFARMLLDSSPTGLALCRMDGTMTEVNPAFSRIIGRSVEECLGLTYWDVTPHEYRQQDQAQLACLEQTGHFGPYEKEYLHKDGHRVPVRLNGRIIEREGQHYIWTAVEDISVVRESEVFGNRLRNILEHSFDEIYIFDSDTLHFIQVSSGAIENLGYSMDELREMTAPDLKPDFSHASFNALIEPLRRGIKQQLVFETRHQRKDGSHYPVEVRLQFSRREVKPVFFAIILDLTERKRIETELALHRQHLEQLVEERTSTIKQQSQIIDWTHDSVITTDRNGHITSWNGGAERFFGINANAAIGRHIDLIYPEHQQELLHTEILPNMEANGIHESEIILRRADGTEFPAHLTLMPLYDDDGAPIGRVGYTMDLSELKRREAQLDHLAHRLQAANKELQSFAYSVSHDLRAPLRAIDGFSLALVEDYGDRFDETAVNYLQRIRNGAQRMGQLIDDLLQLSLVSRGDLALQDVDLSEIAEAVLEELRTGEPGRRLEFTLDRDMQVRGDPRLLRVMLSNLLGNAWKFSARQDISHITFERQADNPGVFLISDNGVGFDMRHAAKLFGAFQRLHRSSDFPGTGVGLATVQRIVNRHGGEIWAEAREGRGASFYFTLAQQDPTATADTAQ